jgi:hypothetical protein
MKRVTTPIGPQLSGGFQQMCVTEKRFQVRFKRLELLGRIWMVEGWYSRNWKWVDDSPDGYMIWEYAEVRWEMGVEKWGEWYSPYMRLVPFVRRHLVVSGFNHYVNILEHIQGSKIFIRVKLARLVHSSSQFVGLGYLCGQILRFYQVFAIEKYYVVYIQPGL